MIIYFFFYSSSDDDMPWKETTEIATSYTDNGKNDASECDEEPLVEPSREEIEENILAGDKYFNKFHNFTIL